jgi:phenylpropionate dioxygenase-like ring-hydroxylating dioxygenase large terminal subunit
MTERRSRRSPDGGAYGRQMVADETDKELTQVGPGTPAGELLRRYWHPVDLSAKVTARPKQIRILGEDLILFRDGQDRPGLLTPHCAHRGASLYYGKVDDDGIRCCYHGWQFDVEGHCLDQPCEPGGGVGKDRIRQPWYPLEERYGMVFAYMGPPEKKSVLPHWDVLEHLDDGESIFVHGYTGFGVGADDAVRIVPMNWLRNWENIMDPFHVPMLHARHSAVQYTPEAAHLPKVSYANTELGLNYIAHRKTGEGRDVERVSSTVVPSLILVPDQQLNITGPTTYIRWLVPVDDNHHCIFHAMRVPPGVDGDALFEKSSRPMPMGTSKLWSEMTDDEHQRFPTDWEAMCGQGSIEEHLDENLETSDRGIVQLRKMLRQQIEIVRDGGDPMGVTFDVAQRVFKTDAGNYYLTPETTVPAE